MPEELKQKIDPPMTRMEAQLKLGLFAKWDFTMAVAIVLLWVVVGFYWLFRPEPSITSVIIGLLASLIIAFMWLIVLAYRALVFILDLHADINLMPEAAARIVTSYFEGRKK
jgi:hypothetical protein